MIKKSILSSTTLLFSILVIALSTSCNQAPRNQEDSTSGSLTEETDAQQIASGDTWLKSIFECSGEIGYCLPDEKKVFTERYLEFYHEELEIYEYPEFETQEEQVAAEKVFKNKWKAIYPLGNEVWTPFGRGNGMEAGDKIENMTITHLSDLKFTALLDYGEESAFFNALILVPSGDAFLIDYIETTLIDVQQGDINLPFLQNLTLAKLQLGTNPDDAKRLLGKPQSENTETGTLEVSGYTDEDYIVTTTTMEYDGIQLTYEDDRMVHAYITKPGKGFGWIICEDKNCDKDFLIEKFKLTPDDLFENEDGNKAFISMEILYLEVNFDENDLVKTIEFNTGP